jgi:hypothetical protein
MRLFLLKILLIIFISYMLMLVLLNLNYFSIGYNILFYVKNTIGYIISIIISFIILIRIR